MLSSFVHQVENSEMHFRNVLMRSQRIEYQLPVNDGQLNIIAFLYLLSLSFLIPHTYLPHALWNYFPNILYSFALGSALWGIQVKMMYEQ